MAEISWRKHLPVLVVPAAAGLLVLALALTPFLGGFAVLGLDRALYDFLLQVKPPVPQSDRILLLDVDDPAIDRVGTWPWPRDVMADGLTTLRELGLDRVTFDIEFPNPSPPGVNRHYLDNELKRSFGQTFSSLGSDFSDLFTALQSKQISLKDASGYASDLVTGTAKAGETLFSQAQKVAQDNDLYLGQAMGYFGHSYVAINRLEKPQTFADPAGKAAHDQEVSLAESRLARPFLGAETRAPLYHDLVLPLPALTTRVRGAGLTNVEIDSDGKRRRIRLYENVGNHWYAQLAMSPVLDMASPSKVEVSDNQVVLTDAHLADGSVRTLTIPLDDKGMMLIPWEPQKFEKTFVHISFVALITVQDQEDKVVDALLALASRSTWSALSGAEAAGANPAQDLADSYTAWRAVRSKALESGAETDVQASLDAKNRWLSDVAAFVAGPTGDALRAAADRQAAAAKGQQKDLWAAEKANLETSWDNLGKNWKAFSGTRAAVQKIVKGKLAFVGYTGTATTDLGVTPFWKDYPLVGTHANVTNAILQGKFLSETPTWWSLIFVLPLTFGLVFVLRPLKPLTQNLAGIGIVAALFAAGVVLFLTTGIFVPMAAPLVALVLTFVAYSLVRFLGTEREKSFLKKAFSTYLSGEVIDEIVTDPGKLKLGGDQKWMTAMFTDVKGFSTISEKLTASELVHLLNEYLSGMSDIVLNEKGTIDKFEGDAIIAFFGAPLDLPDHAARACFAAIRMRQLEATLNPGFLERKMTPTPLLTRIGINTGEMVVGNMGTERKMNYTIMGNAVNLAARLEGVNKQYGTWILTTEATASEAGDKFLFRKLDRVRVVGINTPVRLMNVLGITEEEQTLVPLVEGFHAALDKFETRDWAGAVAAFDELSVRFPEDGPSKLYAKRSRDYQAKAPDPSWDGVFNLTEK
jgi:adenylate cyclase